MAGLKNSTVFSLEVSGHQVYAAADVYDGPYMVNAPDLIVGYNHGYRVSWDCATGVVSGALFDDNVKAWSGDHCIVPALVPGVLFSNLRLKRTDPSIMDVAPTVLELFGIVPPAERRSPGATLLWAIQRWKPRPVGSGPRRGISTSTRTRSRRCFRLS